jgi:hypothetical protein
MSRTFCRHDVYLLPAMLPRNGRSVFCGRRNIWRELGGEEKTREEKLPVDKVLNRHTLAGTAQTICRRS